jgi:hypothetical protein
MNDKNTKVILMYYRGSEGRGPFMEMLKKTTAVKPVIILKSDVPRGSHGSRVPYGFPRRIRRNL